MWTDCMDDKRISPNTNIFVYALDQDAKYENEKEEKSRKQR